MTPGTMKSDGKHYPWLEYLPEGGDRVQTTQLDKETLTIGRSDTADVQIDSTKVSREHAQIADELGGRRIVDASLACDVRSSQSRKRDVAREALGIGAGLHGIILDAARPESGA